MFNVVGLTRALLTVSKEVHISTTQCSCASADAGGRVLADVWNETGRVVYDAKEPQYSCDVIC